MTKDREFLQTQETYGKKLIPKTEQLWETIIGKSGGVYYITSKLNNRDFYFIYAKQKDGAKKLGKGRNPAVLEQKYAI